MKKSAKPTKKQRRRNWREDSHLASPFIIFCGVIAGFYLIYRMGLVVFPAVAVGEGIVHPRHDASIVCGEEEGSHLQDPVPILSASYQKRIQSQKVTAPNKIVNATLADVDANSGQPVGYSYSVENAAANYQYGQEADSTRYLRASSTDKNSFMNTIPPA